MGEIADGMIEGFQCSWCGTCFEESHGYPIVCQSCYKEWLDEGKRKGKHRKARDLLNAHGLQVASNKEI